MTNAQSWTLLGMVGVLLSVIGALIVNQFAFSGTHRRPFDSVDARHLDTRFDSLDRDVQALDGGVLPPGVAGPIRRKHRH